MIEISDKLAQTKKEAKRLHDQIMNMAQSVFNDGIKDVFVDNPDLKSVSWTAYTPFFNDGDACEYSSHHYDATMEFHNDEWNDEIEGWEASSLASTSEWMSKYNIKAEVKKAAGDFINFMEQFDDADLEFMFGDHVKVTIYQDHIEVEEYEDHD